MPAHATAQPMTAHKSGPLTGTAAVPGDKSISHRALIFGAMADRQASPVKVLRWLSIATGAAMALGMVPHSDAGRPRQSVPADVPGDEFEGRP